MGFYIRGLDKLPKLKKFWGAPYYNYSTGPQKPVLVAKAPTVRDELAWRIRSNRCLTRTLWRPCDGLYRSLGHKP